MVEAADFGNGNDRSKFRWLHRSRFRRVFSQREVRPGLVIIRDKYLHMLVQRSLVEDDHMIQALAAYRADDALDVSSLPGTTGRRKHFPDAYIPDRLHKVVAENPISIPQEITRCRVPGKRIAELLSGRFCRWVRR
jgi:hypothetical protein